MNGKQECYNAAGMSLLIIRHTKKLSYRPASLSRHAFLNGRSESTSCLLLQRAASRYVASMLTVRRKQDYHPVEEIHNVAGMQTVAMAIASS